MFVGCNIRISKPHLPRALVKYRCVGVYPSFINFCVNVIHTHTILTVIFLFTVAIIIVTVVVCLIGDIIMKAPGANASVETPI